MTQHKTDQVPNSDGKQDHIPDQIEREFLETLREAAYIFENEKNGRFDGSIRACRAVARFIFQRNGGAELAGPFVQLVMAFEELAKGGKPRLFAKKSVPEKERERSPERKHSQMLAAATLEVLIELGDERTIAANTVARHVNKWPRMSAQEISGRTVIAWRDRYHRLTEQSRKSFDLVTKKMLEQPDARKAVNDLLHNGPPGVWR